MLKFGSLRRIGAGQASARWSRAYGQGFLAASSANWRSENGWRYFKNTALPHYSLSLSVTTNSDTRITAGTYANLFACVPA